jgi:hypothetical protein
MNEVKLTSKGAPWHFGVKHANTQPEWMPSDTLERYQELANDPETFEYFQQHGWDKPGAITYKTNSLGFRCDEFNPFVPCIVTLGCSFTMGIGLPVKDIWPTLVGQELNLPVYNISWGGFSADTCFRLAEYWLPKLFKPQLVVMLMPPAARVELITGAKGTLPPVEVYLSSDETLLKRPHTDYLRHWFFEETNSRLNSLKNKLAIQQLCKNLKVQCQIYDIHPYLIPSNQDVGYARDYLHAGPNGHALLAKQVLEDYYEYNRINVS